jgi:hypothetical protein
MMMMMMMMMIASVECQEVTSELTADSEGRNIT